MFESCKEVINGDYNEPSSEKGKVSDSLDMSFMGYYLIILFTYSYRFPINSTTYRYFLYNSLLPHLSGNKLQSKDWDKKHNSYL